MPPPPPRSPAFVAGWAGSVAAFATAAGRRSPDHPLRQRRLVARRRPTGPAVAIRRTAAPRASVAAADEVDPGAVPGTDLRIVRYPSPILRAPNAEVTSFDADLAALAKGMFKVMYAANGVGLAAPQVGANVRMMVWNPDGDARKWLSEKVLVNPRVVSWGKDTAVDIEGCLSFPGMNGLVRRSTSVKVEGQNLKGKPIKMKLSGWQAVIFAHEYDHLDGVLYVDRLVEGEREKEEVGGRLRQLVEEYEGDDPAL
ncbi:hypothetical protein MMPV_008793 [Pyropia vietnamensis]